MLGTAKKNQVLEFFQEGGGGGIVSKVIIEPTYAPSSTVSYRDWMRFNPKSFLTCELM